MLKAVLTAVLMSLPIGYLHADDLKTVDFVDLPLYVGTWYQVAGIPQEFDKDCVCSRQVLMLDASAPVVHVNNSCNLKDVNGPLLSIVGTATVVDPASNSKLAVDFGMPDKGDYWIIGLDGEYRYAVVSDPTKQSLFILSRTPTLDPLLYAEAVAKAVEQSIDVTKVKLMEQNGCTYPR